MRLLGVYDVRSLCHLMAGCEPVLEQKPNDCSNVAWYLIPERQWVYSTAALNYCCSRVSRMLSLNFLRLNSHSFTSSKQI